MLKMIWTTIILSLLTFTQSCSAAQNCSASRSVDVAYRMVAYFVNWAIYARNFYPEDLPVDKLTHVLYSFANVNASTGEVFLSDRWADTDIHFPGDSWNTPDGQLYGCLNQFNIMKKNNRHLKVLLSIGGSSYSHNFALPASTPSGRSTFASTAVSLVKNFGLDGLDIDWEFPSGEDEANNMVLLLQAVREALDTYGQSLSPAYHFELSLSSPSGFSDYTQMKLAQMNPYLDTFNLMTYNFAGSWSSVVGHQANLFASTNDPRATPFNINTAIDYYISQGVPANKLVLGMPLYGQAFANTTGLSQPFSIDNQGTWQPGYYDYKVLPLADSVETYDEIVGASYSYSSTQQVFISYDTVDVARQKADWIRQQGLGGGMFWESSSDKDGAKSLIRNVGQILGGPNGSTLDTSQNLVHYPDSMYTNIKTGG